MRRGPSWSPRASRRERTEPSLPSPARRAWAHAQGSPGRGGVLGATGQRLKCLWDSWAPGSVLTTGTWRLRKRGKGNSDCLAEGAERRRRGTASSVRRDEERGRTREAKEGRHGAQGSRGRHRDRQVHVGGEGTLFSAGRKRRLAWGTKVPAASPPLATQSAKGKPGNAQGPRAFVLGFAFVKAPECHR